MTSYQVTNPATGEIEKQYTNHSDHEIQAIITESDDAYQVWRTSDINSRVRILNNIADLYDKQRQALARIMAREMGKPVDTLVINDRCNLVISCKNIIINPCDTRFNIVITSDSYAMSTKGVSECCKVRIL